MPIYEYECPKCAHKEEIDKHMSDKDIIEKCPVCKKKMNLLPVAPAFHLKGQGWYVTDYKKTPKRNE